MRKMNFLKADKHRISIILISALILYSFCVVSYSCVLLTKVTNLKTMLQGIEKTLDIKTKQFEKELAYKDFLIKDYKEKNEFLLKMLGDANAEKETEETSIVENANDSEIDVKMEINDSVVQATPEDIGLKTTEEDPVYYEELLWDESYSVQLTESERRDFAALIMLESQGESMECKKAVASVVINRMRVGGLTLREVLYAPNQFEPAPYISSTTPSEDCYAAVDFVCAYGPTIPTYVTFFRADYHFSWAIPYTVIDHTYFSYSTYVYNAVANGL